jgi:hypothetical protein
MEIPFIFERVPQNDYEFGRGAEREEGSFGSINP